MSIDHIDIKVALCHFLQAHRLSCTHDASRSGMTQRKLLDAAIWMLKQGLLHKQNGITHVSATGNGFALS